MKRQQGLSLVELMVGIAIGLMIVATASALMSQQVHDARRLQVETQLDQDLRAAADLIARELRRDEGAGAASKMKLENATLRMRLDGGGWQAITDPEVVRVSRFDIEVNERELPLAGYCTTPCAASAGASCPPVQQLREAHITLAGQAAHDPRLQRLLQATVRLRNDRVIGSCGA